jgi:UDP-N-acetylglucosamine 2-epimerase
MTGPILFEITAADSHQQIILPVIRLLRARGIPVIVYSDCELLRTASDPETLAREKIPFVRLAETPLPSSQPEWEAAARPIRKKIPREVERVRPALVAVLNDRNFPSNVYVQTANRLQIPTLLIQESLRKDLFQRPPWKKLVDRWSRKVRSGIEEGLRHYGQGNCSAVTAWGETSREYFLRVGVPEGKITITGNPRFDPLANADFSSEAQNIRARLGYRPTDSVLTFLSSPIERMQIVSMEEKFSALARLLEWFRALRGKSGGDNQYFVFKLHRGEDPALFRRMIAETGSADFTQIANQALYPLLSIAQAALMFSTTAGLEAALLKVPVGIFELSQPLDDWDFINRGVASGIRSPEDLAKFAQKSSADNTLGARGAQAAAYYAANSGHAAEAVEKLILRMAKYENPQATDQPQ